MAKRSVIEWDSVVGEEEISPVTTVKLVLKKNVNLYINGPVTGIEYHFPGAGSVVDVDNRDAPGLLAKKPNKPCCSGTVGSAYFEQVG